MKESILSGERELDREELLASAVAPSGARPRKDVKFSTATRYPRWVPTVKPRTVMSSVMRRRNGLPGGLMVLSVMGLLPCVE